MAGAAESEQCIYKRLEKVREKNETQESFMRASKMRRFLVGKKNEEP